MRDIVQKSKRALNEEGSAIDRPEAFASLLPRLGMSEDPEELILRRQEYEALPSFFQEYVDDRTRADDCPVALAHACNNHLNIASEAWRIIRHYDPEAREIGKLYRDGKKPYPFNLSKSFLREDRDRVVELIERYYEF